MAHHWSEGVGVLRFTPREYEQELVEAGVAGGLLACPPRPAARFVALKVLQELAWQIRSPNTRKTVLLVPPRRLRTVALEISLLTDLKAAVVGESVSEQLWRDCVENNQVLVVTSSSLDDMLRRSVLTMAMINLLVIEDCHSVVSDSHLQRIIASYKSYKQLEHDTEDAIPKVVAFTHPLFSQEFLLDDESKNSDKQSNTIDSDSEYASSENEEIEDDNVVKPADPLQHFTETVISEEELNEDWKKMTDFNYWRCDFEDIDLKLPVVESASTAQVVRGDECSSEALSQANTVSDVAVNSRSERCFATDSEREPSVRRSIYDKLECQLEKLESMIMCKADMASDIAGLKKITGKPREVILECPQTSSGSEEGKKLEDFMKKVVSGAMVFLKDHRYDPTEIYGDEAFGEELRAIPNPCVEPVVMLQQFLYVLDQSGPYGADKAAFSLLVRIEKLKVKIPYERHFLLLCLVTSVFLQIRAAAELVFQRYPGELERIRRFTRPRFLRMMEIFKIFKPDPAIGKTADSSPLNLPIRQQKDQHLENVPNLSDETVKFSQEVSNKVEIVLDNDTIQVLIENGQGDRDVLVDETVGGRVCDSLDENGASQDSVVRDSLHSVNAGSVTEVLQDLERCDFKRLGRKIEEKSEEIKFTSFGVKRHSCDSGDTEARKKMKCSDCEFSPETSVSRVMGAAHKFAEETIKCSNSNVEEVAVDAKENSASRISLDSEPKAEATSLAESSVKTDLSDSEESTLNTENIILKAMRSSGVTKNGEDSDLRDSSKDSSSNERADGVQVAGPGRMSEAEFEDRQLCHNRPSEDRGAARCSPRKRAWEGGKKGKGKGVRGNYHRSYGWNDPEALCGLVFVDEPLMAKILCALINEYCRSCPELLFVFPQYTVDKMVDPLTDPREAEIEHKRQEEVLKRFRTHECNLLIGTAVLEDGMDLPKCNLVIRWDPPRGYRSYAACRARARAPKSLYALMAPKNPGKLVTALAQYAQIEKMLVRKCSWSEPGPTEEAHAGRFTPLVEPYRPSAQAVSLAQAVQLLNRYCAKLPSDSFTRLVPLWTTEPVVYRDKVLFVCSIRLPINCPLKCQIVGHPMPTRVLARRIAALQVCRALHMSGELDDNLLPIGKENFRALDPDWLSLPPTSDLQSFLDGSVEARPGTTKRKQYYYKKVAHSLSDCRPVLGRPCLAYEVRAVLAVPLPERHNTRGRKLHPPQAYKEGFAILTSRPIHQIPTFPMFTRSGEVQVNLERMAVRVVLNARRERMVHRFMRYTFTEVLRVHNHLMVFDSQGRQKRNSYYVVPTTRVFNPDGSASVAIDWKFLELIYSQTENVAKETILKTLHENVEHVQDHYDSKASYDCDAEDDLTIPSKNESDIFNGQENAKDHDGSDRKLADRGDAPGEDNQEKYNITNSTQCVVDVKEEENQLEPVTVLTDDDSSRIDETCVKLDLKKVAEDAQIDTVDIKQTDETGDKQVESDDATKKGESDGSKISDDTPGVVVRVQPPAEELEEMPNPYLAPGEVFVFDNEKYRDAVVMPWYRNQDQPQYFYVAEICWHLSPLSAFPSSQHATFEDYYRSKYGVRITQPQQPLLDVDHTSARLNLLTPRFVNRKGVALPTSSERTKKAKRESLDQKQILVPELCHTHPFRGALWRAAVALPCVLYRINSLLLADEIRRSVALVVALGRPRLKSGFRWPPLDFGWSLADVLREEGAAKQDTAPPVAPKPEADLKQLTEKETTSDEDGEKFGEKTANDIITEKEEADQGESGDVFEVGMWSNEMAASVPAPAEYDEERDDEVVAASRLPGNITMCPSQGGADWSLATSPRRQNHQRKYSVADSDASYVSSEFDVSGDDAATSDEETDDEDDDNPTETSEPVTEKGGIRIEFKSGNEAEAIEVAPVAAKSPVEDPADLERQLAEERASLEAFSRFFYGRDDEDDEVTQVHIEKFQRAIEFNEVDILNNGVLIPCSQSVGSIKMQDFSETIPFHTHHNNVQMFGARGVIKQWKAGVSSDDSVTDSNAKSGSIGNSTDSHEERNNLDDSKTEVSDEKEPDQNRTRPGDATDLDRSSNGSSQFEIDRYTKDLVVDLRDVDDDRTNPFQDVFEMALSRSEIAELFREMFPYEEGWLDGVSSEDGLLRNGRVTLEDLERNKRRILNEIKASMPRGEWRKYNFFALKDFDDESFESEYADVATHPKHPGGECPVAEGGAFETELEVKANVKSIDKNSDFNVNFSFDQQPDLTSHPGPSPSVILQALTMSNANDGINLERLETIGDSFLKYAITTYLYCTYQNIHEGKLSHLRSKQVSNLNLYRLGRSRALGGRMVASKFEPHDNWLPPCHRVPPHLERALIDTHIPSTLWNVAEMPSLENMSREQIEKLVKEKVALHHSKPTQETVSDDDNKKDKKSGVIRQIVNTDCPVHGGNINDSVRSLGGDFKSEVAPGSGADGSFIDKSKIMPENDIADVIVPDSEGIVEAMKEIEAKTDDIGKCKEINLEDDSAVRKTKEEDASVLKDETIESNDIKEISEDGETLHKEEKSIVLASNSKVENKASAVHSVSESSDEDTDDDDVSKTNMGRGASLKERYRGYLESGLGRRCTCSLVQTPVVAVEKAQKSGDPEVLEDVPCFVPYNLITQHSIPDKSVADCVEALIGAYLIECGPRGALLFMAWLGIRVLPKEEIVLDPDHPFVKIIEEASLKSKSKTDTKQTVNDTKREIGENSHNDVKTTDTIIRISDNSVENHNTAGKREIDLEGKLDQEVNIGKREIDLEGKLDQEVNIENAELDKIVKINNSKCIIEESVKSTGNCMFNARKKSKRPRKRRNKNRKNKESVQTKDESWETVEECLQSPEENTEVEEIIAPVVQSTKKPNEECELIESDTIKVKKTNEECRLIKSDTIETMCLKIAKMEKYNVLPKFVDEMDFWCGDEPIDEDSCHGDDVDYPTRHEEEQDDETSEKDPYDSEDDESDLEDDWNWDDRFPGSLKPQKDGQGRWVQVVFGELKPPPSPLLRNVPDPEGELMQMLSGYDSLERTLGYRFRDRCYLLQAMTHASHSSNRLTDCYQRLEFLGDAVLDYLITRQLYEDPRRHSPGALTDLRSALVNNTIFASLAVRHGMHKYFRHLSPGLDEVLARFVKIQEENGHSISEEHYLIQEDECEQAEDVEVPKALGDLFESVAGAIFLDSGMSLDAVWRVYHSLMQREMEMFSESVPKSPVRELLEMEPETAKFGKPEKLADGRRVRVTVEVLGAGAFKGVGRNYRIAKCTAAKCALRHLNSPRVKANARK